MTPARGQAGAADHDVDPPRWRTVLLLGLVALAALWISGLPFPDPQWLAPRLVRAAPVALVVALAVGFARGSATGALFSATILLFAPLWITGSPALADEGSHVASLAPARWLELLVPHLLTGTEHENIFVRALLGVPGPARPAGAVLYVGFVPLLLALLGLIGARGLLAWTLRLSILPLALLAAGALMPVPAPTVRGLAYAIQAVLAAFAGLALSELQVREERSRATAAALCVGTLAVVLAGALFLAAAWVGSEPGTHVLAPLAPHVVAQGGADPGRPQLEATALLLQRVLDRAALVGFAGMTALLLHLRRRGRFTLAALFVVTIADLLLGL